MVTNHLRGPDWGRAAARGVGCPAWEGRWGREMLKGPVAAVWTGTTGPGPLGWAGLGWGRLSGARVGAGARRSARWGSAQCLRRRPRRCERRDAAPVPSPAPAVGTSKCNLQPATPTQTQSQRRSRSPTARLPRLLLLLADPRLAANKSSHPEGSRRPVGGGGGASSPPLTDNS